MNTNRLKLFPVDRCDADTLMSLTKDNIETGSTVITDGWAAYNDLTAVGYRDVGMYQISGSGWPDIRPFFAIRFQFRQKYWPAPGSAAG